MNILVLGAGVVGRTLVEELSHENYDITVVDTNPLALQELQDLYDIKAVNGHASHPDVLESAGAEYAHILIAATQNDEINLLACHICDILFKIPTKIARIRYTSYASYSKLTDKASLARLSVDYFITPEHSIKDYIYHLVQHPGVLQVEDFANDYIRLIVLNVQKNKTLDGKNISQLYAILPKNNFARIVAIYRKDEMIFPELTTNVQAGDEIFLLAKTKNIQLILGFLGRLDNPYKKIFISGGGHIGMELAKVLEPNHQVKIIDKHFATARVLAETLESSIVINGDITEQSNMINEDMGEVDLFISVTNSDETNAISATMAKYFGAKKSIALLNKSIYSEILRDFTIDIAFSANHITSAQILKHIREGDTASVRNLRRGASEVMEVVIHGNENTCKLVGKKVNEIKWPAETTIGCLLRNKDVYFSDFDITIEAEDHLIIFVFNKKRIQELSTIFKPSSNL